MPGAAQHLMGMGGELARAGLLPACFRGTLPCLFLLLFVFSSCPFFKTVYFFLFSLFLSRDRTWVLQPCRHQLCCFNAKASTDTEYCLFCSLPYSQN